MFFTPFTNFFVLVQFIFLILFFLLFVFLLFRYTPKVVERDPELACSMFDTRSQFLNLCQTSHYQFDQLRRAKHSSMMVLYHLHNPDEDLIPKDCKNCEQIIDGERYTCKTCPDETYNLCKSCYTRLYTHGGGITAAAAAAAASSSHNNKRKKNINDHKIILHEHPLELVTAKTNEMKDRAKNIQLHMTLLVHASACRNKKCPSANCAKMKALLRHGAQCKMRATGGCPTCKRIWALLQIHARQCRVSQGCPVPRCHDLKSHLRRMRMEQRRRDDRRRQNFETGHRAHTADNRARANANATAARRNVSVPTNAPAGRNAGKPGK